MDESERKKSALLTLTRFSVPGSEEPVEQPIDPTEAKISELRERLDRLIGKRSEPQQEAAPDEKDTQAIVEAILRADQVISEHIWAQWNQKFEEGDDDD